MAGLCARVHGEAGNVGSHSGTDLQARWGSGPATVAIDRASETRDNDDMLLRWRKREHKIVLNQIIVKDGVSVYSLSISKVCP